MRKKYLDQLTRNVQAFFIEFRKIDLRDLSENSIEQHLHKPKLTVEDLTRAYGEKPVAHRAP